jgi:chromosome segregation ATPase
MSEEINGLVARNSDLEQELHAAKLANASMLVRLEEERAEVNQFAAMLRETQDQLRTARQHLAAMKAELEVRASDG